ncbi:MAG: hypothetical protein US52_C0048G0007 [candidate division WS6 bacterium GW2011_GWA2_37_6]|uniref:Uncharacterized protein n=1 Tax=candidate division WS6 bacterium GW2011_GWA2_37_6 TaxID=1619087 RepID=A0A0G0JD97_9BACT|nr:MAG: hypothetical protein US52_C0048G0007 [candidate division WS6 bacterium GW2011_GWA2_37_6]
MNNAELEKIVLMILKIAGIIVVVFNAGVGLILLRQAITMNNVIKVGGGILFITMILIFLLVTSSILLYAIAI